MNLCQGFWLYWRYHLKNKYPYSRIKWEHTRTPLKQMHFLTRAAVTRLLAYKHNTGPLFSHCCSLVTLNSHYAKLDLHHLHINNTQQTKMKKDVHNHMFNHYQISQASDFQFSTFVLEDHYCTDTNPYRSNTSNKFQLFPSTHNRITFL